MSDQELWDRDYEEFLNMERSWREADGASWGDLDGDGWDDPDDEEDDWR